MAFFTSFLRELPVYENKINDLYNKFGYFNDVNYFYHYINTSNNSIIYYEMKTDSLIVFNKNLQRVYSGNLMAEIKKHFKNEANIDTSLNLTKDWDSIELIKDNYTEKLYIRFKSKNKGFIISELNIDLLNKTINFKFLRDYKIINAESENISINKGVLYITILNQITNNNYVYKYDLYKSLSEKDKLLEIKFAKLASNNKEKKYKISGNIKYNLPKILNKKQINVYFGEIKKDTVKYKQNNYKAVFESIIKSIENDSLSYAASQLMVYDSDLIQEINDDIEYKEYSFFKEINAKYDKNEAILYYKNLLSQFDKSEKELYNDSKLIVRTPNNIIYYMYKINNLWYLSAVSTKIYYN